MPLELLKAQGCVVYDACFGERLTEEREEPVAIKIKLESEFRARGGTE
jgi:hypothetical protein